MTPDISVECVPNFSEGRDAGVVDTIAHAVSGTPTITGRY
jgi:glutamate formiminotransferase